MDSYEKSHKEKETKLPNQGCVEGVPEFQICLLKSPVEMAILLLDRSLIFDAPPLDCTMLISTVLFP